MCKQRPHLSRINGMLGRVRVGGGQREERSCWLAGGVKGLESGEGGG